MVNGFDIHELTNFQKDLLNIAQTMPKESKKFMKNEGKKLKKETVKVARTKVKKKEGNYLKSIKSGKVYQYNGMLSNRVYSNKPHAHLIEYGHRQVLNPYKEGSAEKGKVANIGDRFSRGVVEGKGIGKEIGFIKGKRVFETAKNNFESEYFKDTQDFIDFVLDEGLN